MRMRLAVALAAVVLIGAACASDGGDGAGAGGGETGAVTGGTGSTGSSDSTGSTGSTGGGAAADVTVTAVNFQFDPAQISVATGDVIEVRDTNPQTPHTFTVEGTDIDLALDPQSSGTVTIDLDPGTYDVVCRFHATSQGMTATLTVG